MLAVVLFHYGLRGVTGGYIGVDVFFVISGFLMTQIVITKLAQNRFGLFRFYGDRFRRISPALLGLVLALNVVGYVFVEPTTYQKIGQTSAAALTYVSNILFYRQSGYFNPASGTIWLLHTWSLSVEFQFYILYPLFLLGVVRIPALGGKFAGAVGLAFALSLALAIVAQSTFPQACFYLLPTRAWELLAGALVFILLRDVEISPWLRRAMVVAGLALIITSALIFDLTTPWPSYRALLPVMGACLFIGGDLRDNRWFKLAPVAVMGGWSYAIYIWHWPILVGVRYFEFGGGGVTAALTLIVLFVIYAAVSRAAGSLTEKFAPLGDARLRARLRWASLAALCAAGSLVWAGAGLPNRKPEISARLSEYSQASADVPSGKSCGDLDHLDHLRPCVTGTPGPGGVLVIGDSHAEMIETRMEDPARTAPTGGVTYLINHGCPPVPGVIPKVAASQCAIFNEQAYAEAKAGAYSRIVIASMWVTNFPNTDASQLDDDDSLCFVKDAKCYRTTDPAAYNREVDLVFSRWTETLRTLREQGKEVIIVLPFPGSDLDIPLELAKRAFWGGAAKPIVITRSEVSRRQAAVRVRLMAAAKAVAASTIDPVEYLCDASACPTLDQDGAPLYLDSNHFRAHALRSHRFDFLDVIARSTTAMGADDQREAASRLSH